MSRSSRVEVVVAAGDDLGEGPHWDPVSGRLLRVDSTRGRVIWLDPATFAQETIVVGPSVGFAIPRIAGGLIVGVEREIRVLDSDDFSGSPRRCAVAEERPRTRFNDAKCDEAGRLWAGTMSTSDERGAGALYRLTREGLAQSLSEITVSNGPAWNLAGDRMYFADSPSACVDVFDYDLSTGTLANRRPFIHFPEGSGFPDGMTVDAEDCLWVCAFEGGEVRRHDDRGRLVDRFAMPVSNPTSLAFGGPDLDVLFVTSARHRVPASRLPEEPLAGAVFSIQPATTGISPVRCAI